MADSDAAKDILTEILEDHDEDDDLFKDLLSADEREAVLFAFELPPTSGSPEEPVTPPPKRFAREAPPHSVDGPQRVEMPNPLSREIRRGSGPDVSGRLSPAEGSGGTPRPMPAGGPTRTLGLSPPRRSGLIIGDSLVRHAQFATEAHGWQVDTWVPCAEIGKNWRGCTDTGALLSVVRAWADTSDPCPSGVALWMGGNDVYPRRAPPGPMGADLWSAVTTTVAAIAAIVPVFWVGPTPRPSRDRPTDDREPTGGVSWEETEAFRLERDMVRWAREQRTTRVTVVSVGRCVTERTRHSKNKSTYSLTDSAASKFFMTDGVHLSAAGYARISHRLPHWMKALKS